MMIKQIIGNRKQGIRFSIYLFTYLLIFLSSCTEEIDIRLKSSDKRLVVDGGIGMEPGVHTVILSTTVDYFATNAEIPYVSDAYVTITEFNEAMQATGRLFRLLENPTKKGHYETEPDVFGKQGHTYRLNISNVNVGKETHYTADAFFPYIAEQIDSVRAVWWTNLLWAGILGGLQDTARGRNGWNIELFADDPEGENYYIFITYKNGIPLNDTLTRFLLLDNTLIDQNMIGLRGIPIEFISDSSWAAAKEGDTLGLEIRAISKDYYRYINEFRTVYGGSNPMFGGAPANVRGNVSGGAIGYFWAHGNRKAFDVADRSKRPTVFGGGFWPPPNPPKQIIPR
ncbi:MAG: DUF4249 domain-containing protein [Bacteroidales bacterium]|jgi:hypothetical protein|nr:DUF4249 domain-containing protein [Bacteroidales bacterium]